MDGEKEAEPIVLARSSGQRRLIRVQHKKYIYIFFTLYFYLTKELLPTGTTGSGGAI